jgi:hypothetical protein
MLAGGGESASGLCGPAATRGTRRAPRYRVACAPQCPPQDKWTKMRRLHFLGESGWRGGGCSCSFPGRSDDAADRTDGSAVPNPGTHGFSFCDLLPVIAVIDHTKRADSGATIKLDSWSGGPRHEKNLVREGGGECSSRRERTLVFQDFVAATLSLKLFHGGR